VSFELLLPVGAIAFYLFDSAALLYGNEFIFTLKSGSWVWSAGSDFILRGRRLYLPNPLTPQRLSFRTAWSESQLNEGAGDASRISELQRNLRLLGFLELFLLVLIALIMPVVLALLGTGVALLAVFAACYGTVLVMIGFLIRNRARLGLSTRQLVGLSLDGLLCPPFGINLVRKITLRQNPVGDPVAFAKSSFAPTDLAALVASICKRLELDMAELDRSEAKWMQLEAYRERLMSLST